ncbi:aminodeoxychorismate lyase [Mycolicibacterium arenosum]|uniref:Aminodeoxychorismate lyase n=1 Tax=Mycolicibacterium arenosum TaxID=2952157 RepID=A0ABT1LZM2_9MYCO|nr:aminodeoxychorismate lyase [Mycolicibacterium sp. CAU 1645]MCP9271454.1 aminodeoxychorismate lyase [Mycolicibacterium sp. CAU 1645]
MAPRPELVVTLDGRVHGADAALVRTDDPLFSRGDGVFETLLLRAGAPCLLDAHLRRLGESAALVGLPAPETSAWRRAVDLAVDTWGDDEGVLRMVHGRGTAFVVASPLPERVLVARRDGVAAITLPRRLVDGPWSPVRAKSSSYAANAAALRQAVRSGADDAVFVDAQGVVLEGPRSAVVIESDGALVTASTDLPILAGTTVTALFDVARQRGVECRHQVFGVGELLAAQAVWLLSAITLAVRVHTLDGNPLDTGMARLDVPGLVDVAVAG